MNIDPKWSAWVVRLRLGEDPASLVRFASLTETRKMNGVEPYAWLESTLETIVGVPPAIAHRRRHAQDWCPADSVPRPRRAGVGVALPRRWRDVDVRSGDDAGAP